MKTKCKRLLSLLLVFVLVLGLMPSVYAATDEGTQPTTEPAVTEATTETAGEDPTVPETTGATEPTDPSESTEGTEATEEPTESEEDWTQPPEDDGMSLEEWDQLRFDALSCELPAPIEEYFPFDPSIQYPYGIPVEILFHIYFVLYLRLSSSVSLAIASSSVSARQQSIAKTSFSFVISPLVKARI